MPATPKEVFTPSLIGHAVGALRLKGSLGNPDTLKTATGPSVIVPAAGRVQEWTTSSRLLAEIPGRIWCLSALPDGRSLRFVWGIPRQAEDIDIATGRRRASPLVPAAYREGCPDLSPDGKQLIFEGHDPSGGPVILRSPHPDGSQASAVVKSEEPDTASAPKWLANGEAFAFSLDSSHVGLIESGSDRLTVAGADFPDEFVPYGWIVGGNHVYMAAFSANGATRFDTLTWPSMNVTERWALSLRPPDCQTLDGITIFCDDARHTLVVITPKEQEAYELGRVSDQTMGSLALMRQRIGFVTFQRHADAWLEAPGGKRRLTSDGTTLDVARCGEGAFLLNQRRASGDSVLVRLSTSGELTTLTEESSVEAPLCADGGKQWWFNRTDPAQGGYFHCVESKCDRISTDPFHGPALSPDGTRIAYVASARRGMRIRVMSTTGTDSRTLVDSETYCAPGWSSNNTLWVSRHRRGKYVWTEVDATSGAETGRSTPGSNKDCHDWETDPASPVDPDLRIVVDYKSQVRWQPFPVEPSSP